jgi:uncharacterized protein (TIGR03067 family)
MSPLDPLSAQDLAALQGVWEQVALEVDGQRLPSDELSPAGGRSTFIRDRFEVHGPAGALLLAGTFELDARQSPKQITWFDSIGEDADKSLPAIYRLEADVFEFIAGTTRRPLRFHTEPGETMRTFARVR